MQYAVNYINKILIMSLLLANLILLLFVSGKFLISYYNKVNSIMSNIFY